MNNNKLTNSQSNYGSPIDIPAPLPIFAEYKEGPQHKSKKKNSLRVSIADILRPKEQKKRSSLQEKKVVKTTNNENGIAQNAHRANQNPAPDAETNISANKEYGIAQNAHRANQNPAPDVETNISANKEYGIAQNAHRVNQNPAPDVEAPSLYAKDSDVSGLFDIQKLFNQLQEYSAIDEHILIDLYKDRLNSLIVIQKRKITESQISPQQKNVETLNLKILEFIEEVSDLLFAEHQRGKLHFDQNNIGIEQYTRYVEALLNPEKPIYLTNIKSRSIFHLRNTLITLVKEYKDLDGGSLLLYDLIRKCDAEILFRLKSKMFKKSTFKKNLPYRVKGLCRVLRKLDIDQGLKLLEAIHAANVWGANALAERNSILPLHRMKFDMKGRVVAIQQMKPPKNSQIKQKRIMAHCTGDDRGYYELSQKEKLFSDAKKIGEGAQGKVFQKKISDQNLVSDQQTNMRTKYFNLLRRKIGIYRADGYKKQRKEAEKILLAPLCSYLENGKLPKKISEDEKETLKLIKALDFAPLEENLENYRFMFALKGKYWSSEGFKETVEICKKVISELNDPIKPRKSIIQKLNRKQKEKCFDLLRVYIRGVHTEVAVKNLHENPLENQKKAFLEEIKLTSDIEKMILNGDQMKENKKYFVSAGDKEMLVTKMMKLGSLQDYLENNNYQISPENMLDIFTQISLQLQRIHESPDGIIHYDCAARNILISVTSEGRFVVKIADFGLSKRINHPNGIHLHNEELSNGPLKIMPPEIMTHQIISTKYDVWSFGALVSHMMRQTADVYPGLDPFQAASQVMQYQLSPAMAVGPNFGNANNLNKAFYAIVKACSIPDMHRRPNMSQVYEALNVINENVTALKKNQIDVSYRVCEILEISYNDLKS